MKITRTDQAKLINHLLDEKVVYMPTDTIPGLVGKYGLYDAYSFMTKAEGDKPWIGSSYLGIDKGLVALMFENYSTQMIWTLLHKNDHIQRGLKKLEFRHVASSQRPR